MFSGAPVLASRKHEDKSGRSAGCKNCVRFPTLRPAPENTGWMFGSTYYQRALMKFGQCSSSQRNMRFAKMIQRPIEPAQTHKTISAEAALNGSDVVDPPLAKRPTNKAKILKITITTKAVKTVTKRRKKSK